jgi:hypothetical protein
VVSTEHWALSTEHRPDAKISGAAKGNTDETKHGAAESPLPAQIPLKPRLYKPALRMMLLGLLRLLLLLLLLLPL